MDYGSQTNAVSANNADNISGKVTALSDYISRLNNIASNAESVADRISGSHPTPSNDKTAAPSPVPNGLSETITHFMRSMSQGMDRIEAACQRADRALG